MMIEFNGKHFNREHIIALWGDEKGGPGGDCPRVCILLLGGATETLGENMVFNKEDEAGRDVKLSELLGKLNS